MGGSQLCFSGWVPLLTLFVHCFLNQSRDIFQELQGRQYREVDL